MADDLQQLALRDALIGNWDSVHMPVFTHGYNVSFEEAARRAAQLAFDLNFRGRVVLFSWPSCGSLLGYGADEERALLSAHTFRGFL
jgi:esterase/lipase superfamily enzyme